MAKVEVFDPPMCCSTGVCGPSVDPALAAFAADLGWLAEQGVAVERHNLSQEPKAFADSDLVRELLAERGDEALPAVVVDGALRSAGRYPSRDEMVAWSTGGASAEGLDAVTSELVALGAAVGANCEPCFKFHYNEARRLGVGSGTMAAAVRVAQAVKDTPAGSMLELAAKLLGTDPVTLRHGDASAATQATAAVVSGGAQAGSGGCCGGEATAAEATPTSDAPSSGCCGGDTEVVEVSLAATGSASTNPSGCCG
jgi:AhpD family alkylhydroperoxidase